MITWPTTLQATEEDRAHYDKLYFLCKQASEAYLQGNVDNALLYYDESIRVSSQDNGVRTVMFQDIGVTHIEVKFKGGQIQCTNSGGEQPHIKHSESQLPRGIKGVARAPLPSKIILACAKWTVHVLILYLIVLVMHSTDEPVTYNFVFVLLYMYMYVY